MEQQNNNYCVIVSERALRLVIAHTTILAKESVDEAERLIDVIFTEASKLSSMPYRFPWFNGEYIVTNTYHKLLVENRYLLLYKTRDNTVYIDYIVDCEKGYRWLIE